MIEVDDSLWDNGAPSSPDASTCVAMNREGKLDEQDCGSSDDPDLCFVCEDFGYSGEELPACA